jgi:hypothetical protein
MTKAQAERATKLLERVAAECAWWLDDDSGKPYVDVTVAPSMDLYQDILTFVGEISRKP